MRTRLPVAGLLAALVLSAPASAGVVGKKVSEDPATVNAYWTDARMRDAKPAERGRDASKPRARPGGGAAWSTVQVSWLGAPAMTNTNGKVFFTDSGVNYVCSGTAVATATRSVVWTAGHCVHDGPGTFHTNWTFVPAYNANGVQRPFGTWAASNLYTTSQWASSGEFGRDLGAATVAADESLTNTIGAARPVAFTPDYTINRDLNSYGYPAAGKFNGQSLYLCDSYLGRVDTSTNPDTMGIPCGMTGGSSGGAWIDAGGNLASVNSYGYSSLKNTMFGPVLDSEAAALLSTAGG